MSDALPPPPVSPDADLKDFPFTPIYRARLFGSSFHARATDAEWRAGVTLWLKSQDQVPAGSLPDDDVDLCRLAELGRDLKTWRKIKAGAMHGWTKYSDSRLYHPVIAEVVNEQLVGKMKRRWATDCARARKQAQRRNIKIDLPDFEEWLSLGQSISVPWDNDALSQGHEPTRPEDIKGLSQECHMENASNRKGEGQGQGQGRTEGGARTRPGYAFEGQIIRLEQKLFDEWRKVFHAYPDLRAELTAIDAKLVASGHQGPWIGKVSGWLRKGHETRLSRQELPLSPEDEDHRWRFHLGEFVKTRDERGGQWAGRGYWPENRGVPPGRHGCQVPDRLLREFNLLPLLSVAAE